MSTTDDRLIGSTPNFCKLRHTSDTLVGRARSTPGAQINSMVFPNETYDIALGKFFKKTGVRGLFRIPTKNAHGGKISSQLNSKP